MKTSHNQTHLITKEDKEGLGVLLKLTKGLAALKG